jgi:ditrans,polycis-polyprenyl diphosphate synthase
MPYSKEGPSELCSRNVAFKLLRLRLKITHRPITEKDIENHLKISSVNGPPLDVLIRTSGVKRLSDYLLWQVGLFGTSLTKYLTHPLHPVVH